jgi:AcrR family transcriptional regulator
VFVHFGSLDGLISAVVEDFGLSLARTLQARTDAGAGPREVLQAYLDGLADHEAFYARLVVEGPLLPAEARLSLVGIQSALSHHLAPVLAAYARPGVPEAFLFNLWVGLVHRYLGEGDLFGPPGQVLSTQGARLIDQFLALLSGSEGGTR